MRWIREHLTGFLLALTLAAVAVQIGASAVIAYVYQQQRDLAASQDQVTCQQRILGDTAAALTARTYFAEQQARTQKHLDKAQRTYLESFTPTTTTEQAAAAFATYEKALGFAINATHEQLTGLGEHPFPTKAEVAACK